MQPENHNISRVRIPEHYLFWTFETPHLLKGPLYTSDGRLLSVIEKGEANLDNGPDYLNARLQIEEVQVRGDLEFHINWRDWYRHGHDKDRRYERVVLHILWNSPQDAPAALLKRFPHLVLSQFLSVSETQWLTYLRNLTDNSPVAGSFAAIQVPGNFRYKKLAWQRFQRKYLGIKSWVREYGWETTIYLGLAKVLGYAKNSDPFIELVKKFPPDKLRSGLKPPHRLPHIYWLMLGWQSGLLQPLHPEGSADSGSGLLKTALEQMLRQYRHIFPLGRQDMVQWNFSRLRPRNSPYLRLAGYAQLVFHFQGSSLFGRLLDLYTRRLPLSTLLKDLEQVLCRPLNREFNPLLQEMNLTMGESLKTMGRQRCRLYQLNFLLPLMYLWARVNHHFGFARYIEDLYFQYPVVDDNSKIRALMRNRKNMNWKNAYQHQALLEFYYANIHPNESTIAKRD